ncbi:MAG: hypothetical protein LUQ27_06965 [Methanomassiliicoccales archaeon]|nr:hypothetical protein [Methanomassiliicoccales archaeon]
MNPVIRDLKLIRLMMSEERRLNAAMIGKAQFSLFPVMILLMAFVIGLSSRQLLNALPIDQVYLILHSIIILYGLAVGGFALFGERIAQKRFGEVALLLETPTIQPIDFRHMFLAFYVKDIVYYITYSIIPLVAGIALTIPFTGFRIASVLFLLLTLSLSFLLGISFSFLLSSLYVRWKVAFAATIGAVLIVVAGGYLTGIYNLPQLVPPIMLQRTGDPLFLLLSVALVIAFSIVAIATIKVRFGVRTESYDARMLPTTSVFRFFGSYSAFMAKEWIDLRRSGTLMPVIGAYVGPLAFLAVLFWFLGDVLLLPLHFNMVFFAAMIGFFGVSIYGWLNLLDTTTFFEVLPVSVVRLVKTKLLMFSMLAASISTVFLVILSVIQAELHMLWISLIVAYCTTTYTVSSTAYLTGLRTNSYLFDPRVLLKFAAVVIPPLVVLTILSFYYIGDPLVSAIIILALSATLVAATLVFCRRIGEKWGRESFVF